MNTQKPSIGRIVIYNLTDTEQTLFEEINNRKSAQCPAIVTNAEGNWVNLKVFVDGPQPEWFRPDVPLFDPTDVTKPGTWEWPPRI